MKFYLSSYGIGNQPDRLQQLIPPGAKAALIPNAVDAEKNPAIYAENNQEKAAMLETLGYEVDIIDLRTYFGKKEELKEQLANYQLRRARGGNVFVLRQAMRLSGFDELLTTAFHEQQDVVYGGYSAGVCVLAPRLEGLELVDDAQQQPYDIATIREGLHLLDYMIVPHYRSDHPEAREVEKTVQYLIDHQILFKALRDGEVIIVD